MPSSVLQKWFSQLCNEWKSVSLSLKLVDPQLIRQLDRARRLRIVSMLCRWHLTKNRKCYIFPWVPAKKNRAKNCFLSPFWSCSTPRSMLYKKLNFDFIKFWDFVLIFVYLNWPDDCLLCAHFHNLIFFFTTRIFDYSDNFPR